MYSIEELQTKIADSLKNLPLYGKPDGLYQPISYTMEQGGKRLRPLFVLISNQMFGGNANDALPAAVAIEIFHNFTLLHDDIIDQAPLRRGFESVYQKWNTNIAILSGDTMFAIAYGELAKSKPELLPGLMSVFTKTAIEVCEGQQFDIDFEEQKEVKLGDYLSMIRLKTAVLLAASLKIGAIIARVTEEEADRIYDFGINLGIAFQLQDDLLDAFGDQQVFGKQTGGDIAANKKTVLYLKAVEKADVETATELDRYYSSNGITSDEKVKKVMAIFNKLDVKPETEKLINEYFGTAIKLLDEINVPEENKQVLRELAYKMLKRIR
ncbi:MAG TPA: polyprenyl synthetase family protein [Lentimicrobium sp.]|nr:polyprenyl synthetase family protein [Lentimicrobium sp.]